jgi:polar amino acid transport system substrate-binding protein
MEVNLSYAVPPASPIVAIPDADRARVKIGVGERNAADLFLSRSLKNAELVRVPDNLARAVDLLKSGQVHAFATNREGLLGIQAQMPEYRIVPGRFHAVQHAVVLRKRRRRRFHI